MSLVLSTNSTGDRRENLAGAPTVRWSCDDSTAPTRTLKTLLFRYDLRTSRRQRGLPKHVACLTGHYAMVKSLLNIEKEAPVALKIKGSGRPLGERIFWVLDCPLRNSK
jgi:hypothetical protein